MKIAFFSDTFLPQVNGVVTSMLNMARGLKEKGHEVYIFTPDVKHISREKFKEEGINVIYLPSVPAHLYPEFKLSLFALPKVLRALRKINPDIIHLHTFITVGFDGLMAAKILKKPLVGTVHPYFTDPEWMKWIKNKLVSRIANDVVFRVLNFFFSSCDLVLCPSTSLIKELRGLEFEKPLKYLPNPITQDKLIILSAKKSKEIKKRLGLKDKVILHIGRLSYEKKIDLLIKSTNQIVKKSFDVSLLIIGDGPAKKDLEKLTKSLNLQKDVIFTGFIAHQKLISSGLINVADLFATASAMENNPMSVLEAMAYGLPIVGINAAGMVDLVKGNGFLVKKDDTDALAKKMNMLLHDKKLAIKMGQESIKLSKDFSTEKVVTQLVKIYEKVKYERKS